MSLTIPKNKPPEPSTALVVDKSQRESLIEKTESAYRTAFAVSEYEARHLRQIGTGRILALHGTSSAGKSSIIARLKPGAYIERGIDLAHKTAFGNLVREHTPQAYGQMIKAINHEDLFAALIANTLRFKNGSSEKERQDALTAIHEVKERAVALEKSKDGQAVLNQLYEEIAQLSFQGEDVVYDEVADPQSFLAFRSEKNFSAPLEFALVYCPLDQLVERIQKRNRSAFQEKNEENMRFPFDPLKQFGCLYGSAKPGDTVLGSVTRKQVEDAIEAAYQLTLEHGDSDMNLEELAQIRYNTKEKLLADLGFADPTIQVVQIAPRFKNFHYLIDTSKPIALPDSI